MRLNRSSLSSKKHSQFSAVQKSRVLVMAHVIFFRYSPVNNALSPSRADARDFVNLT